MFLLKQSLDHEIGLHCFTGHHTLSHFTLASCSSLVNWNSNKLQNTKLVILWFRKANGHSERQQDESDLESLLVLRVGEGTSARFAVVVETSHHAVEPGCAAFTVLALRVVLAILQKHMTIIVKFTLPVANANCWAPLHSTIRQDSDALIFPSLFKQTIWVCMGAPVSWGRFYLWFNFIGIMYLVVIQLQNKLLIRQCFISFFFFRVETNFQIKLTAVMPRLYPDNEFKCCCRTIQKKKEKK